ncbi:alpha/beta hydrolase [Dactylosporangium aurantiacum]|uniref:Alpha/beta hydrolase n=1 Tax=Dactylosporangium aurantiacum TaxID=35754 RepID=A0A9Q9MIE0_9ACTN|nr:alpha/beta hydrolase [Dactylosporangium aurantiacum]MDG6109834.1 alpha/beta hydrolase [Dactylosporangium aurantiacum]UWZ57819.1 alpha/beta hydrolase [Dactylosporangium aurantiacum]
MVIERFVEVPGGYLYSRTHGAGPDVVLLHAGAADLRMWDSTVGWLASLARVTVFDFRDMGLSSRAAGPYREVDDIAAVLDAAGVRRAVLVGVSDGARRALAFACAAPERVVRVVAVGGAFGEFPDPTPEEAAARQEMRGHFARLGRLLAEEGLGAYAAADIGTWGAALGPDERRKMVGLQLANAHWIELPESLGADLDPPVKTRFAELSVPVDVVVGGRDLAATRLWARRIAAQAPHAALIEVPEGDHFPMLSAPAEFERVLREAIDRAAR